MRTMQITIEEELLHDVDEEVARFHSNRSAFVRQALQEALKRGRIQQLEEAHRRGYAKHPVKVGEFDEWEAEQVWGE